MTSDFEAKTCPEAHLQALLKQVEEERDALAAHVERINAHARSMGLEPEWSTLAGILADAPATSLARREARMKSGGIKEMLDHVVSKDFQQLTVAAGRAWEERFRQQAEADQ